MNHSLDKPRRRSIRLKGYDYTQAGAYFVTVCTHERKCLFGEVVEGTMRLNESGRIVEQCWQAIPKHFPNVELDAYVVMPNHIHGILLFSDIPTNVGANIANVGANHYSPLQPPPSGTSRTLGSVVRGFKIGFTKWYRQNAPDAIVLQRNYYEHIVRNEDTLAKIREYIVNNPLQWTLDRENPANVLGKQEQP